MGFIIEAKAIALAVYIVDGEAVVKPLFNDDQIRLVNLECDDDIGGAQVVIVKGKNLSWG